MGDGYGIDVEKDLPADRLDREGGDFINLGLDQRWGDAHDEQVVEIASGLKPSARGELEIADVPTTTVPGGN